MMHIAWSLATTHDPKTLKRRHFAYQSTLRDLARLWKQDGGYREKLQMESHRIRDEIQQPEDPSCEVSLQ